MICLNCEIKGHTFKYCRSPIISYGIIVYRIRNSQFEYLLLQRRDTVAYIDFLRGKYDLEYEDTFKILLEEMTNEERNRLITFDFDTLWETLWINKKSKTFLNEFDEAKKKFENLDIHNMVLNTSHSKWDSPEWGYAKGRRSNNEKHLDCALREFSEETGYNLHELDIKKNVYLHELYFGSNSIAYKHEYYLAEIKSDREPFIDKNNILQSGEIQQLKWVPFKTAINMFREYHSTKRNVLYRVRDILERNRV